MLFTTFEGEKQETADMGGEAPGLQDGEPFDILDADISASGSESLRSGVAEFLNAVEMECARMASKRRNDIGDGRSKSVDVEDAAVPSERHGDGWFERAEAVEIEIVGMSREADRCGKIERAELVEGELATVAGEGNRRCR